MQRKLVEFLPQSELLVDRLLGDAKVRYVEETLSTDGLEQQIGELLVAFRGAIFGKINVGNCES